MKKRLISIMLALCMVLCLVPTTAFAEGETVGKAAAANSEVSVTVTSAAEFVKAIDDTNTRTEETTIIRIGKNFTVSLSECEGYFLIKTKVIIDLNYHGFSIKQDINSDKAFYLTDGAELTIRDSTRFQYGVLKIIGNGKNAISAVRFSGKSNATLRLESGTVEGENLEYNRKMVDGRVYGTPGGFVRLDEKKAKFIMTGGTIKNFYGVYGGAVSLEYGTFLMEGGTIQNCYARNGGAISVDYGKNAVLTIGGGSGTPVIKNNSAIGPGGALSVSSASSKVEIKGGLFEDNYSTGSDDAPVNLKNGAELYVDSGCEVKMSGGTIKNSGTSQYAMSSAGKFTVTGNAVIDINSQHCTLTCSGTNNYFFDFDGGYAIIKGKYAAGDAFSISDTNGLRFGSSESALGEIRQEFRNEDIADAQYIKIAKKRTVTFKLAENEPTTLSSQTVLQGEKIQKPADPPKRDGYIFNDIWAIPSGGGYIHWNFDDDVLTEDTTLYGRWSGYRVKITFNANGYSMSGQSEIYGEYGQKLKDLSGVPTINPASFMKFIGWYTQSSGGTKVDENTVLTDNMTLYAKCAPQYTVFICYQYENDEGQRVTLQTMNHLDENGRVPKPSVQPVHKTGYVFDDWYVGEVSYGSLTDNYTNLKTVADLFREYGTMDGAQGRIYLVARYVERNDYSVIFKSEDSVIDTKSNLKWTDKVLDGVSMPTRDGYDFVGFKYGDKTVTANTVYSDLAADDGVTSLTLTAQWSEKADFAVKFHTAGGTELADKTNVKWTDTVLDGITDPTRSGYTFNGWKCGDTSVTADTTYAELAAGDTVTSITLTAQWTVNWYTIIFNTNGGSEIASITQDYGTDITEPDAPTREGYTFAGWDKTIPATMPAENMTITAQWTDSEKPTGEIKISDNSWKAFLNNITFGMFFKDTQTVTITAADNSGDAVTVEYLLSNKELTKAELDGKTFTEYTAPFGIDPDNEYIIYVRLTDKADNTDYICSDGIVLDGISPVITGIENGKTYCAAQLVTVDEKYIDTVKVNGNTVNLDSNNQFTLNPAEGEQTIVVTDKAGNETRVIVTVNDGHTYEWQSENGQYWQKCKFCNHETAKKDIPTINISGADKVCRTQDYKFSFTLPEGATDAAYGYEFIGLGDGPLTPTVENGLYSGIIKASAYPAEETGFKLIVSAKTADGFEFSAEKTVAIQNEHSGGTATCTEQATCEICGEKYGDLKPHSYSAEWSTDETNHWHECTECRAKTDEAEHTDTNKDHKCDVCDKVLSECTDTNKDHKCDLCGKALSEHSGGKATCKDKAKCEFCGESYGELNANNHSDLKHFPAVAATKTAEGNIEYWYCSGCKKYYKDAKATQEITKAQTVTAKLPSDNNGSNNKPGNNATTSPQTGDNSNFALWIALLFISGGVAIGTTIVSRKKKYNR